MTNFGKKTALMLGGAAVIALSVAGSAIAGGFGHGGGHGGMMGMQKQAMDFATLDANGDGKISAEDAAALAAARFAEADSNGDGQIDQAEMTAQITAKMEERGGHRGGETPDEDRLNWMAEGAIMKFDADKSGTLSAEEATPDDKRFTRMIERFDEDDDGALSEEEFDAAKEKMRGRGGRDGGRGGHGNKGGFWGGRG
jgi:Ca2+-binding EF-hand superfamily protein